MLSKYKKANRYLGVRGELTLPNVCIITGEPVDGASIQTTIVQRFFSPLQVILLSISTISLFLINYALIFYASLYVFYRFCIRYRLPVDVEFYISQRAIRNSMFWNFCAAIVFGVLVAYYERLFPGLLGAWLIHYCLGRTELFIVKGKHDYVLLQGLSLKAIDNIVGLDIEFIRPDQKKKNGILKNSIEAIPSSLSVAAQTPSAFLTNSTPEKQKLIDISNRNLSSIPQEVFHNTELNSVRKLLAANNSFGQIPESLLLLENLNSLDLSNTRLKTIFSIGELENLSELYINSNRLKEIPKDIRKLHLLTMLDVSSNRIESIPAEITFTSLSRLKLHNNFISNIPEELVHLRNLTHLDLSHNKISSLPENIGALKNLEQLYLHNNNITSLPTSIARLRKLKKLNLGNNKLTKIPEEITELVELQVLNLASNEICEIPEQSIQQLHRLDLANNKLTQITIDFPHMTSLNIANNNIENISQEILCSKMQKLNLSDNKLATLPKRIFENGSLKELLVNNNQLSEIPCTKKLWQLNRLELRNNLLQKLPPSLVELNMCEVDVRGNLILDIPLQLLDKVKYDKLKWNTFDKPLPKNPFVLQTSTHVFQLAIEECVSYAHVEKYEEKAYVWHDNELQEMPDSFDHLPKDTVVVKNGKLHFVKEKRRFEIKKNFSHYALLLPYPEESSLSKSFVAYDGYDFCHLEIFNASLSFDEKFISMLKRDVKRICDTKGSSSAKIYAFDKFQEQVYFKTIFLKGISLKSHSNSYEFSLEESIYWIVQLLTQLSKLSVRVELITLNNIYLYHHFIHLVGMTTIKSKYPVQRDLEQVGDIKDDKYYFFSPEIYSSGDVNQQSSIYSLGIVFYFFLTGKYPFKEERLFQLILEIMSEKYVNVVTDNPSLDSHPVCDVVHKMLARKPEDRYANEKEVIDDIKAKYPQNFLQNFCLLKVDAISSGYELYVAVDSESGQLCQIAFFENELDLPANDLAQFDLQIQHLSTQKGSYVVFPYIYYDTLEECEKKSQLSPCKIIYFALEIIEFLEKLARSKLMPLLNEKMIIVDHKGRILLHLPTIFEQIGNKNQETSSLLSLEKACNLNTENEIYYRLPQEIITPEYSIAAQIYSLGVAMYHMVSKEYPYDKEELLQMKSLYHKKKLLSDESIPCSLQAIINKMISYLGSTYSNWDELKKDLELSYYELK
ncbi:leucine-rich repeat domain-containing protein [Candidatus Uabimicrobium sp. HlEnr_7]|uniref:leucine-rich repeat domain-containing protein n=1 Tax=Candidatus Uabimicrobium helgolandensis TaxID=3095367 RepID=UPI0035569FCF